MRGIGAYKSNHVQNAPKSQLVTLLFQEATKRLHRSAEAEKFDAAWIQDLAHVRAIYTELLSALDPETAPAICRRLAPLYNWCIFELIAAGNQRSTRKVIDVLRVTETLLEGWTSAMSQPTRQSA